MTPKNLEVTISKKQVVASFVSKRVVALVIVNKGAKS